MARYKTTIDRWLSHECRLVKAGEEFEAEFPKEMKLADTLQLIEDEKPKKGAKDIDA